MTFDKIFSDSFETFKIFSSLDVSKASFKTANTPKSIWQILNHLIIWQKFQLNKLQGLTPSAIDESSTWEAASSIDDPELLEQTINVFNAQIEQIKAETRLIGIESTNIEAKLKIVQEFSIHLSFHIGEMILQMRQNGHYPMPSEMKNFLAN